MQTELITVDAAQPESDRVQRAAAVLRSGGLVAFPTETVYGLGADALNPNAVEGDGTVTQKIAAKGLEREGVDQAGLDGMDRKILNAIASHHGTPVGVKTIAVIVGEEEDTIEDVYEPFLIQEGYILKTPRGRLLSGKGYAHLGLKAPKMSGEQPGLF